LKRKVFTQLKIYVSSNYPEPYQARGSVFQGLTPPAYGSQCLHGSFHRRQCLAQSKGAGGFSKATTEISSYENPVSNLMKALAAVIVIVGAFNVYFKMQNGDQDVKKTIMLTIGGCVAFIAMSEALPLFFK
jgi:hypothetical protein